MSATRLCAYCDEAATHVLVGGADLRSSSHDACIEHERMWGRLYRRSVRLPGAEADIREIDLLEGGTAYPHGGASTVA